MKPEDAESRYRAALERLPYSYAIGLRLKEQRCTDEVIAEHLEIDVAAVPALLNVAESKLRALLDT